MKLTSRVPIPAARCCATKPKKAASSCAGRIELTVGTLTRVLNPGDAYYFDSRLPHRFRNVGDGPAETRQRLHAAKLLDIARFTPRRHLA